jgi:hypothetical protein
VAGESWKVGRKDSIQLIGSHFTAAESGQARDVAIVVVSPGVTPSMSIIVTRLKPRLALPRHVTSIAE